MEEDDVIEPATRPTRWCSAIKAVPKEDGSVRICTDARQPNKVIIRERHPQLTIDDIIYDLNGASGTSRKPTQQPVPPFQLENIVFRSLIRSGLHMRLCGIRCGFLDCIGPVLPQDLHRSHQISASFSTLD